MLRCRFTAAFLLAFVLCADVAHAAEAAYGAYDPESILGFTRHLILQKEYYRAHAELDRLRFYYPARIPEDRWFVTELFLLFNGKRYAECVGLKPPAGAEPACIGAVFTMDAYFMQLKGAEMPDTRPPAVTGCTPLLDNALYRRSFLYYAFRGDIAGAETLFRSRQDILGEEDRVSQKLVLDEAREHVKSLKKPWLALCLGTVPGLGYAYAGNKATGILAFALAGLLTTATFFAVRTENLPIAVFTGGMTVFFYGGSVIGGYREALRHNDWLAGRFREDAMGRMALERDREEIFNRYGIMGAR